MSASLLSCVTSEGGLLPPEILQRILAQERGLQGLTPADYHIDVRLGEASSRAWTALQPAWRAFRTQLEKLPVDDTGTTVTRKSGSYHCFASSGLGGSRRRQGSSLWKARRTRSRTATGTFRCTCSARAPRSTGRNSGLAGAARMSPHGLVQQFLNRSDAHLWGIVSNRLTVRLLRDHYSLSTAAYLEFDLEAMFEGGFYSEFLLLFLLLHQSRFEAEKPAEILARDVVQGSPKGGSRSARPARRWCEGRPRRARNGFPRTPRERCSSRCAQTRTTRSRRVLSRASPRPVSRALSLCGRRSAGAPRA